MRLRHRIESVERSSGAPGDLSMLTDAELDAKLAEGMTTARWTALWEFAREMGWSELKISEAKEILRHLIHET